MGSRPHTAVGENLRPDVGQSGRGHIPSLEQNSAAGSNLFISLAFIPAGFQTRLIFIGDDIEGELHLFILITCPAW
jgi:hypothetical protein